MCIHYCKGKTWKCWSKRVRRKHILKDILFIQLKLKTTGFTRMLLKENSYCLSLWGLYFGYEGEEESLITLW